MTTAVVTLRLGCRESPTSINIDSGITGKKMKRLVSRVLCALAMAGALVLATGGMANAALPNLGPYAQLNCHRNQAVFDTICGSVPAHSSQHWIQSMLDCTGVVTTSYQIIDHNNGHVVDSGHCSLFGSTPWKYTVGLYGSYDVKVTGSYGVATIRNCTSSCHIYNQG